MDPVRASKLISYALRADPGSLGLTLDADGWVDVPVLLRALNRRGHRLSREEFQDIVTGPDAGRFEVAGGRVRASGGP